MGSFEDFFEKSSYEPAKYRGRTIMLADLLEIPPQGQRFLITFELFRSNSEQGILLSTDGIFYIANHEIPTKTILWQDSAPRSQHIFVKCKSGQLMVRNAWNFREKIEPFETLIHFGHNGAAMVTEDLPHGRRYYCNDGYPDDDFDDLIFRIERVTLGQILPEPPPPAPEKLFPEPSTDEYIDPILSLPEGDPRRLRDLLEKFSTQNASRKLFGERLLQYPEYFQPIMQGYKHEGVDLYQWLAAVDYNALDFKGAKPVCRAVKKFLKKWKEDHPI